MTTFSSLWYGLTGRHHKKASRHLRFGWAGIIWPLMTAFSVVWFLVRVIPKPTRATYPCQQAAFPLLSATVVWLLGLKGALVAWLQPKKRARRFRRLLLAGSALMALGFFAWAAEKSFSPNSPRPLQVTLGTPSGDPPNSPIGIARGIFPGRVAWTRDTNATPWDGKNGYWWQDTNGINQAAVDRMVSMSLHALTGSTNDADAWDQTFKYYNSTHGRGRLGYAPNEEIAIKINLNNSWYNGNLPDASQQTVLALLRQLVNQAGVPQTNITVYDAVRPMPDRIYQPCHQEFPSVQWVDTDGKNGQAVSWVTTGSRFSVTNSCGGPLVVPSCVHQATYLINMPLLKGHGYSGVTLAGKNHYGSIPLRDHSAYLVTSLTNQPLYSMLVDLMGSRELGDKTILYVNDGLFGNSSTSGTVSRAQCAFSNLFNGQWSASIFMSFDPVAIDSVCADFLYAEFGLGLGYADACGYSQPARNCDRYLHEAALADHPASGTVYQPDGVRLGSLGVHEHWNNPTDKLYSRNFNTNGAGIELVAVHELASQITLSSPTNGAVFSPATNIVLQVVPNAFTPLSRVDYFANGTLLGSSTNAPFGFIWTNPPAGNFSLSAKGTDPDGYGCTSAVVNVQVLGIGVAITNPNSGAAFLEGTNVTVQASVFSDFGPVSRVDFYANGSLLGSSGSAPFSIVWTNLPAGSWGLSATARNSTGLSGTSDVVNITVARDVRVALTAPSPGEAFPVGTNVTLCATAACPLTAISRVDFYEGANRLGTALASPYCVVATNLPPGFRSLFAVATETGGFSATSAVVNVAVTPKQPLVAGTLYVDLRATNFLPGSANWANQGVLGNFSAEGGPGMEGNAAGTAFPGVHFTGGELFFGPNTVPDIDGSSDRSIEVWALHPAPLGTSEVLVSSGASDSSFSACYGADPTNGAFMQVICGSPSNSGWATTADVPPPGVWHHLVYVYDGATQLNIYVDGQLSIAGTLPAELWTSQNTPILIGVANSWSYCANPFSGYINSVRIHGGALSPGDVWVNYLVGPVQWQLAPVTILTEPADLLVPEAGGGVLSVVPDGAGPFNFQWYRTDAPLAEATNSSYTLTNLQWADSGSQFFCVISPPYSCPSCTVTSRTATVTVQPQLPVVCCPVAVASKQLFGFYVYLAPGGLYRVDYKEDFNEPGWIPVGPDFTASSTGMWIVDPANYLTNHQRFYRVVRLQ
jgi:hypothetical protein